MSSRLLHLTRRRKVRKVYLSLVASLLGVGSFVTSCRPSGQEASIISAANKAHAEDPSDPMLLNFSVAYAYPQYTLINQPVTLFWDAPKAERVELQVPGQVVLQFIGPRGSTVVYPPQTMDYILTAYNKVTSVMQGINIQTFGLPGAVRDFYAEQQGIPQGSTTNLRWFTQGCDFVEIREESGASFHRGYCGIEDGVRIQPGARTKYIIDAFRYESFGGDYTNNTFARPPRIVGRNEITVDVFPAQAPAEKIPQISFQATDSVVEEGQPVHFFWSVEDGVDIRIDPPITSNPDARGSLDIIVPKSQTYRLSALSKVSRTRVESSVSITVNPRFRIEQMKLQPETINKGEAATISWSTVNCRRVWITKLSGERIINDQACNGATEVRPDKTTQYIVRVEHGNDQNLRTEDALVAVTVVGETAAAIPVAGQASPAPQASTSAQGDVLESSPAVIVPRPRDVPRIISLTSNKYTGWTGDTIKVRWKAIRADRVIMQIEGQLITLPAKGTREFKVSKTGKISIVAENSKYRTIPTAIEITVNDKALLDKLYKAMTQ